MLQVKDMHPLPPEEPQPPHPEPEPSIEHVPSLVPEPLRLHHRQVRDVYVCVGDVGRVQVRGHCCQCALA
jgi:hypothetical protein